MRVRTSPCRRCFSSGCLAAVVAGALHFNVRREIAWTCNRVASGVSPLINSWRTSGCQPLSYRTWRRDRTRLVLLGHPAVSWNLAARRRHLESYSLSISICAAGGSNSARLSRCAGSRSRPTSSPSPKCRVSARTSMRAPDDPVIRHLVRHALALWFTGRCVAHKGSLHPKMG